MSEWTSLSDIMRDLSVAQGSIVPASLETFGSTRPPIVNIEEVTEADYYKSCGDADFTKPADYLLIQEMLTVVNNKVTDKPGNMHNSELNPLSPEFVPQSVNEQIKSIHKNNVAITSILEAQARSLTVKQSDPNSPKNMFRKKQIPNKKIATVKPSQGLGSTTINNNQYIPSKMAEEYYKKYLSNAKLEEQLKNEIWAKAEEQIREIDERKKLQIERSRSSSRSNPGDADVNLPTLPYHRHLMLDSAADCVVCNVAAKHGFISFKEDLDIQGYELLNCN